jgi:hypothetical protein
LSSASAIPSASLSGQPCKEAKPGVSGHLSVASGVPSLSRSKTTGGAGGGTTFFFQCQSCAQYQQSA